MSRDSVRIRGKFSDDGYSADTRDAPLGNWKPLLENETSLPTSWSAAIIHVRFFFHCVRVWLQVFRATLLKMSFSHSLVSLFIVLSFVFVFLFFSLLFFSSFSISLIICFFFLGFVFYTTNNGKFRSHEDKFTYGRSTEYLYHRCSRNVRSFPIDCIQLACFLSNDTFFFLVSQTNSSQSLHIRRSPPGLSRVI